MIFLDVYWHKEIFAICVCAPLLSCVQLYNPMDYSPTGSSVHVIFQATILEWLPFPSVGDLSDPGIEPPFLALQTDSLPSEHLRSPFAIYCHVKMNNKIYIKHNLIIISSVYFYFLYLSPKCSYF